MFLKSRVSHRNNGRNLWRDLSDSAFHRSHNVLWGSHEYSPLTSEIGYMKQRNRSSLWKWLMDLGYSHWDCDPKCQNDYCEIMAISKLLASRAGKSVLSAWYKLDNTYWWVCWSMETSRTCCDGWPAEWIGRRRPDYCFTIALIKCILYCLYYVPLCLYCVKSLFAEWNSWFNIILLVYQYGPFQC